MWIFSTYGFFSVVCLNNRPLDGSPLKGKLSVDKERVAVRARVRAHLENLLKDYPELNSEAEILDTPGRDYACRIVLSRSTWAEVVRGMAQDIDYENFKGRVGHADPLYAEWLSRVWGIGHGVQAKSSILSPASVDLLNLSTRAFIQHVRRSVSRLGWKDQPLAILQALKVRGWIELRGTGPNTKFDLTEEGQRRLGVIVP